MRLSPSWTVILFLCFGLLLPIQAAEVEGTLSQTLRPGLTLEVERGCGAVYQIGEYLTFTIRAERDGYLTVFDFWPDGTVHIVFPNNYWRNNFVYGGQRLYFPGKFSPYRFEVAPPEGKEILFAVVTERPHEFVPQDYIMFQQLFPELTLSPEEAARVIARAINVIPADEWWAAAMCVFFVGKKPQPQPQPQAQGWGLFIGISDYAVNEVIIDDTRYTFEDLTAPAGDARSMANVLRGSFTNQKILTDRDATYAAIRDAITDWLGRAPADATVLIYYSGHGAQIRDRNGDEDDGRDETWVTTDGKMIVDDELYRWVQALPARRVVIISDSCHSGTIHRGLWMGRPHTFYVPPMRRGGFPKLSDGLADDFVAGYRAPGKVVALSACRPHESAWESTRLGHGLFTYCLLQGLEGGADGDGDGVITAQELYAYARDCVPRCTQQLILPDGSHPVQNPELHDAIGQPVPLARVR